MVETGLNNIAEGAYSHAEGEATIARGVASHAEGQNTMAIGTAGHAEGVSTFATGEYSHARNLGGTATGNLSSTSGAYSLANVYASTAIGRYNIYQTGAVGNFSTMDDMLSVGNGTGVEAETRSNAFRVRADGNIFATGNYSTTGADYAEYFEWEDGNPDNEDRVGLVVTLVNGKIRKAEESDRGILGIISATPSVIGDNYDDDWNGRYLTDAYGRLLTQTVELEYPELNEAGELIHVLKEAQTFVINPEWNPEEIYAPRAQRKEWDAVGLMGKLYANSDGSCALGDYVKVGGVGLVTKSEEPTNMQVIAQTATTIVRIFVK